MEYFISFPEPLPSFSINFRLSRALFVLQPLAINLLTVTKSFNIWSLLSPSILFILMSWIDGKPVLKYLVIKLSLWNWLFLSIFLGGWEKSLYYLSGIIQPTCVTNSREPSNLVYIFVQHCLLCYKFLISISKTLVQLNFLDISLLSNCNTF